MTSDDPAKTNGTTGDATPPSARPTIAVRQGAPASAVLSLGVYRPRRIVDNEEICRSIDSTDEWIRSRTGIGARRHAGDGEGVKEMSIAAAEQALAGAPIDRAEVDALLLCTSTWPQQVPHGAPVVAAALGLNGIAAMDITAGCAGFGHGLGLADSMVRAGTARAVIVIGADRMMDGLDLTDRSTAFIFGDGAGAVIVGPSETPGIGPVVWGSDGENSPAIRQDRSIVEYMEQAAASTEPIGKMKLVMEGQRVFKWAAFSLGPAMTKVVESAGLTMDDVEAFIPHQANGRINELMYRKLKLRDGVPMATDIERTGNTSAASIPLAMDQLLSSGQSSEGDLALCLGFGAGLTFAGQMVRLPAAPVGESRLPTASSDDAAAHSGTTPGVDSAAAEADTTGR